MVLVVHRRAAAAATAAAKNSSVVIATRHGSRGVHVARSVAEVREYTEKLRRAGKSLGFAPTMGALHAGHISLINRAKQENDVVASSIFVNPTQFSAGEDLDKYPRTFDKDMAMLTAAGTDLVFAPAVTEIYPAEEPLCHVEPAAFGLIHEGQARPEFFRGVATIVTKLFNIVQPTRAYFGQKDISQCILIARMVRDLNMPVDVRVCATMREADGLAMSSRNTYLTPDERPKASVLYRALSAGKRAAESGPAVRREEVIHAVTAALQAEPSISRVEYVSVACPHTMRELDTVSAAGAVLSSAVRLGTVRLIDNLLVGAAEVAIYGRRS